MIFKALGILLAVYTGGAALQGKVYAKAGPTGRTVSRDTTPVYFWTVIAVYVALSVALLAIF